MSAGAGEHTPEPWRIRIGPRDDQETCDIQICGDIFVLADLNGPQYPHQHPNAERIVACVNACAGIPTDQLSTLMGEVRGVLEEAQYRMPDRYNSDIALSNRIAALLAKLPVQP